MTNHKRLFRTAAALGVCVLLSALLSICLGPVKLSPAQILLALFEGDRASTSARIIAHVRLPRTFASLLTGAALAVSGAMIQSVLENPLAAPNVIGVNTGAGLAVALCSALMPGAFAFLPVAAFLGALAGVLLVMLIGERTGASRLTLVLAGIAVSAVFSGAIDMILTLVPESLSAYSDFRIGGFAGVTMQKIRPAAVVIGAAFLLASSLAPQMELLALGQDTARSLGLRVKPVRILLLTAAAALAGAAVSVAGLVGFVGLIVPHAARKLSNGEGLWLLVFSALGGAAFVTVCDLIARTLFSPYELPVGIVLSFLGGPFFLWLILRRKGGRGDA
ncbi:MAG: iron ABC transporter permease [Oscillospiraceae bacterium]|nr:iron ABC transporter permease [Oscillospiraceae bacterium]